jgi:phosphoribosylaminoimidazolecarboxamide formyltransferase / IMP cyclohydrolase
MVDATLPGSAAKKSDPNTVALSSTATTSHSKPFPAEIILTFKDAKGKVLQTRVLVGKELRYGENPDQRGAVFEPVGISRPELFQRKSPSYCNETDADRAFGLVEELDRILPDLRQVKGREIVAIRKHGTACGLAIAETQPEAYSLAFATDMDSAYGGIIATNTPWTLASHKALISVEPPMNGEKLKGHFVEVIAAPGIEPGVYELMESRQKSTIRFPDLTRDWQERDKLYSEFSLRSLLGGRILLQDPDYSTWGPALPSVVSNRAPTDSEWDNAVIAWVIAKHTPSNAIVYVGENRLKAITGGSQRRSDAAWISGERAKRNVEELCRSGIDLTGINLDLQGTSAATDGFAPFKDTPEEANKYGAMTLIAPHGGKRDQDVIDEVNRLGMAMLHTEKRAFRH